MGSEYRTRVFKSGNSVALRLPKKLGLTEGTEMTLREEHGQYIATPTDMAKRRIRGDWIGSMPWLEPLKPEDRASEERQLDWDGIKLKRDGE